jgi:hypothetical protein
MAICWIKLAICRFGFEHRFLWLALGKKNKRIMKKVLLLAVFIVGTLTAEAQTQTGNLMLGGALEFRSTSRQAADNSSSFTLSPSVGYFMSDNFALGLSVGFETNSTGTGSDKTVNNSFGLGPFARYYVFTSNSQFGFFGQAALTFGTGASGLADGPKVNSSYLSFALSPGAAYFFNEHWALELMITTLGITSRDPNKDVDNDKTTEFTFGVRSLSPSVGIRYHF